MLKIIMPVLLVIGAFFLGKYLIATGPEAKKKPSVERVPVVEVVPMERKKYTVYVQASGIVTAGIQSNLVAEVTGKVVSVSNDFQEGSYFSKNQVLLEIDKENYLNAEAIAKSEVEANRASLKQIIEEDKSNQRSIELAQKNLALGVKEVERVRSLLRKNLISRSLVDAEEQKVNQLQQKLQDLKGVQNTFASRRNAVESRITSTLAKLKQESLNLSRTTIKAPYTGRVLNKNVDIGQYVSVGTVLGEIYATDYVNVELPLSLNQYELLDIPEAFRDKKIDANQFPEVTLTSPDSLRKDSWKGRVVRTGAALDAESRQINVIVRVDNPYDASQGTSAPIRIGQYLKASIKGKTFKDVFVLPPVAVLFNREIRILKDGKIKIIPVNVLWNTSDEIVVATDKQIAGEKLILTTLEQATDGMKAVSVEEQREKARAKNNKKPEVGEKKADENTNISPDTKGKKTKPEEQTSHSSFTPEYLRVSVADKSSELSSSKIQ